MSKKEMTDVVDVSVMTVEEEPSSTVKVGSKRAYDFTPEEYDLIFMAIGTIKTSLNDPMLPKLIKIQQKLKVIAETYGK